MFSSLPSSAALRPRSVIAFCLVLLAIWFGCLQYRDLFNPDEGRYAQIPHEMNVTGDWVTPRLDGFKYFEKPALQYWGTAAAFELFGEHAWTARLWTACTGALSLWLVFLTGRRMAGPAAGAMAAIALASSPLFFAFSQILTLDMGVSFFMTLTLAGLFGTVDERLTPAGRSRWALAMWLGMALALLSKGLIGIVLPGGVLFFHLLLQRDWRLLRRLRWGPGLALFGVVSLPWFVIVQARNPEFFDFFFIHEHFARFAETGHHRTGAWYYFIVLLLVGSLPWTIVYVRALVDGWRQPKPPAMGVHATRLLVIWTVLITLFFSISRSKLPGYIVPVFPALALLYGQWAVQRPERMQVPWRALLAMGLALLGVAAGLPQTAAWHGRMQAFAPYLPCVAGAGAVMLATGLACRRRSGLQLRGLPLFALGVLVALQLLIAGAQTLADRFSSTPLLARARVHLGADFDPSAPFYSVNVYDQTVPRNVGRLLLLVDYGDELTFGQQQEPDRAVGLDDFRQRWQASRQSYAVISPRALQREQASGLPLVVLADNGVEAIIARRLPGR